MTITTTTITATITTITTTATATTITTTIVVIIVVIITIVSIVFSDHNGSLARQQLGAAGVYLVLELDRILLFLLSHVISSVPILRAF